MHELRRPLVDRISRQRKRGLLLLPRIGDKRGWLLPDPRWLSKGKHGRGFLYLNNCSSILNLIPFEIPSFSQFQWLYLFRPTMHAIYKPQHAGPEQSTSITESFKTKMLFHPPASGRNFNIPTMNCHIVTAKGSCGKALANLTPVLSWVWYISKPNKYRSRRACHSRIWLPQVITIEFTRLPSSL